MTGPVETTAPPRPVKPSAPTPPVTSKTSLFTGTAALTRLALRRDRIQLPVWLLGQVLFLYSGAGTIAGLYSTESERAAAARTVAENPALLVLRGAPSGSSEGAMLVLQEFGSLAVVAAFMTTLAVIRHTRQNEEAGRSELIGSAVVGRHASLTAALIVAVSANIVLAALVCLVLVGTGLPFAGSLAAGAALGSVGIAFAGVAAIAAQVSESSRGANGLAAIAIGAGYLLRGIGNVVGDVAPSGISVTAGWPSWITPMGWNDLVRPFDQDRSWVLLLPLLFFLVTVGGAVQLTGHRDVGTGMLPVRNGPPTAPPGLLSPLGLAWRLQRSTFVSWLIGLVLLGGVIGSLGKAVSDILDENANATDLISKLGGGGDQLVDAYYAGMIGIMGVTAAGYVVQSLLRLRSEESAGALESVLATAVSRPRWMASHLTIGLVGSAALLAAAGAATGFVRGLIEGDLLGDTASLTGAALAQTPAVWVLGGVVALFFGLLPRWSVGLSWAVFAIFLVFSRMGELIGLPQAAQNLSPFSHLPALPAADFTATPLVTLLAVAVLLTAAGVATFRRRDLA